MSARAPALLLVVVALAGALLACGGGGGDEEAATPTTDAPAATTTTTEPSTTTTQSAEERAIEALEGMTSMEEAQFRLFSNPPEIPGPLPPLNAVAEPIGEPVPILRAGPDGLPVVDAAGNDIIVGVRVDALGRPVAADDGRLLDDQGVEIPRDAQGPILLFVQRDEAGNPRRHPVPPPAPTTTTPAGQPTPPPTPPPLGRVVFERRGVAPANRVVAVGDSVLLGIQGNLPGAVPGWAPVLDAQESRLPGVGDDVILGRPDLGRVLVVMLGHNVGPGEDYRVYLSSIQQAIDQRPVIDRVVWVTAAEIGGPQLAWNEALRAFVAERRAAGDIESHLLDWALYNAANPGYSDDGLHLTLDGRAALAGLIAQFVGPSPGDCDVVVGGGPQAGTCA
jgi:hypothetical protein